jgi:hypothetical protein
LGAMAILSTRKFADLARVSEKAIRKARVSGRVVAIAGGSNIDTAHPVNAAFLVRHLSREAAAPVATAVAHVGNGADLHIGAALSGVNATLLGRLYDLSLWRVNTRAVENVRAELHDDADYFLRTARNLPVELGCLISLTLGTSPTELVDRITRAMTAYLARLGDQHQRVEQVIEKVQAQWVDFPLRRVQRPPAIPEFVAATSHPEARARLAAVRGDLVEIKMRFRSGELVARAAATFAANDLRVKWTTELGDHFPISCAVELFPSGNLAWAFAQACTSVGGSRLGSYWDLGLSYGNFSGAMAMFAAERWRRHGHSPRRDELDALRAADRVRVAETHRLRRERLEW